MKGESSGSTKFFSNKFKSFKAKVRARKNKNKEDKDGDLESSGKKFSSNGSLVSQANGVKSGSKQNVKGEQGQTPDCSSFKNDHSMNRKELQSQAVAENNLIDTVEFVTPSQNVRNIDTSKSISPPSPCEIVSLLPHTPNTFTEIDKRTTHFTTHTEKNDQKTYLQPPTRGIDEFVSGEKGSCFIINTKRQGKINSQLFFLIIYIFKRFLLITTGH